MYLLYLVSTIIFWFGSIIARNMPLFILGSITYITAIYLFLMLAFEIRFKLFHLPLLILNLAAMGYAYNMHLCYGSHINDYLLAMVWLGISCALIIKQILYKNETSPSAACG